MYSIYVVKYETVVQIIDRPFSFITLLKFVLPLPVLWRERKRETESSGYSYRNRQDVEERKVLYIQYSMRANTRDQTSIERLQEKRDIYIYKESILV